MLLVTLVLPVAPLVRPVAPAAPARAAAGARLRARAMTPPAALVWLRGHDLRVRDHAALDAAAARGGVAAALFVHFDAAHAAPVQLAYLHHSLDVLRAELAARGVQLLVASARSPREVARVVASVASALAVDDVLWNRAYCARACAIDAQIHALLRAHTIGSKSLPSELLVQPDEIVSGSSDPFTDFQPYSRFWQDRISTMPPPRPLTVFADSTSGALHPLPRRVIARLLRAAEPVHTAKGTDEQAAPPSTDTSHWFDIKSLGLLDGLDELYVSNLLKLRPVGCLAAVKTLKSFLVHDKFVMYADGRARRDALLLPGKESTSTLSPHVRFGELSPRTIYHTMKDEASKYNGTADGTAAQDASNVFIKNMCLREFGYYILFRFPDAASKPIMREFEVFPWERDNCKRLHNAWARGSTGFPIVDAAMRQLGAEGWIHNRLRFLVASFYCKYLLLPWPVGANYMYRVLVDGDEACNSLGWQWTTGCNSDSFPFSTLVNPITVFKHSRNMANAANYIRRYVPELSGLPDSLIFTPWRATQDQLREAKLHILSQDMFRAISKTDTDSDSDSSTDSCLSVSTSYPSNFVTPYSSTACKFTSSPQPWVTFVSPQYDGFNAYPKRIVYGPDARSKARKSMEIMRRIFAAQRLKRSQATDHSILTPEASAFLSRNGISFDADRRSSTSSTMNFRGKVPDFMSQAFGYSTPTLSRQESMEVLRIEGQEGDSVHNFSSEDGSGNARSKNVRSRESSGASLSEPGAKRQKFIPHSVSPIDSDGTDLPISLAPPDPLSLPNTPRSPLLSEATSIPSRSAGISLSHVTPILETPDFAKSSPFFMSNAPDSSKRNYIAVHSLLSPRTSREPDRTELDTVRRAQQRNEFRKIREAPTIMTTAINEGGSVSDSMSRVASVGSGSNAQHWTRTRPHSPSSSHTGKPVKKARSSSGKESMQRSQGRSGTTPTRDSAAKRNDGEIVEFRQSSDPSQMSSEVHGSRESRQQPNESKAAALTQQQHMSQQYPTPRLPPVSPTLRSPSPAHVYSAGASYYRPAQPYSDASGYRWPVQYPQAPPSGHANHAQYPPYPPGASGNLGPVQYAHPGPYPDRPYGGPSNFPQPAQPVSPHVIPPQQNVVVSNRIHHAPHAVSHSPTVDRNHEVVYGVPYPGHYANIPLHPSPQHAAQPMHVRSMMLVPRFQNGMEVPPGAQGALPYSPMIGAGVANEYVPRNASHMHLHSVPRVAGSASGEGSSAGVVSDPASDRAGRISIARRMAAMDYDNPKLDGKHKEQWQVIALHLLDKYEFCDDTDRQTSKSYVRLCVIKDQLREANREGPRVTVNHCKQVFGILGLPVTGEWDRRGHGGVRGPYVYGLRPKPNGS